MDLQKKLELIKLPPTEEIVTESELAKLLEEKRRPVAYDGFEPSGLMHLGTGLLRAIKLQDFLKAKVKFILYIADWFAYLNNKMGGDLEAIKKAGQYFIEGWKACGVDIDKVKIIWASKMIKKSEYWETLLQISRKVTLKRVLRSVTIAGRKESEVREASLIVYPLMQCADIFTLNNLKPVDICQLGMDQRKVNMLARDVAEKMGFKKPIAIHHHLLAGLQGPGKMVGYDENKKIDLQISSKMSKSLPDTAIFIHDSKEEVERKIRKAYCPARQVENNPVLEICKYIIFRKFDSLIIKREEKYGGKLELQSYEELEKLFKEGKLHPLDLKKAVAEYLNLILEPVRSHFEKGKARRLYEFILSSNITR